MIDGRFITACIGGTALAALAACSAKPVPAAQPSASPTPHALSRTARADQQAAAAIEREAAKDPAGAARRGLPVTAPSDLPMRTALPTVFQGRWGLTPADCDDSRPDAKGLLRIEKNKLTFYEATGTVKALDRRSRGDVIADIEYKGEGQTWTTHTRFALVTGGIALLRTEQSPVKTYRYSRC